MDNLKTEPEARQFIYDPRYLGPIPDGAYCAAERDPRNEHFSTGSRRDSRSGKGRYDLESLIARELKARVNEFGAGHYGDRNWEKGQPLMRYFDSANRHLLKWAKGQDIDPDSGLPHLAHAAWNIDALLHTAILIREGVMPDDLDDRPTYGGAHLNDIRY